MRDKQPCQPSREHYNPIRKAVVQRIRSPYCPTRFAGIGTTAFANESSWSGVMSLPVISDSNIPGESALTRTGMFFKANSVASILVTDVAAALDEL